MPPPLLPQRFTQSILDWAIGPNPNLNVAASAQPPTVLDVTPDKAPTYANPLDEILSLPRNELFNKHPVARGILQKAAYPSIMAGALGATAAGIALGVPNVVTFTYVSGAAILASTATEYLIPSHLDWMPDLKEIEVDFLHNALTTGAIPMAFKFLAYGAAFYAGSCLARACGVDSFWSSWGLSTLPLAAQAGLILGVGSFGDYWKHRLLHKIPQLWPIHNTHHSSEKLTTLHAGRSHVLDILGTYTMFLSLGLFGMPDDAMTLASSFIGTNVLLQHSNADLDLGKLAYIFPGPRNHRWHHSTKREESDTNFGNFLTLWDHVFGTFYLPKDRVGPQKIGLNRSYIDAKKNAFQNWLAHMKLEFSTASF